MVSAVSSSGAFSPFAPMLPMGAFPGVAPAPAGAPGWSTPWDAHGGDQFGLGGGAAQAMAMAVMKLVVDQALLALLVTWFERLGGQQSRDVGQLGGGGGGGGAMRPTSWSPSGGGGGGGGGGRVGGPVDTRAPASLGQLPQGDRSVGRFLQAALAQNGDEYQYGAGRNLRDANPDEFDCSGLVYWACNQAGINPNQIGGNSGLQAKNTRHISVQEALRTPGALLFKPGHVAISLGDGRTIEAMGEKWGVRIADANGRGWTSGGLIPGMDYGGSIGVA
jgi:hypothetical protein